MKQSVFNSIEKDFIVVCVRVFENKFSNSEHIRPICCYFINYSKWQKFRKIFHFICTSMFYTMYYVFAHLLFGLCIVLHRHVMWYDGDEDDEDNDGSDSVDGGGNNNNNSTIQRHTHFAMRLWYANGALFIPVLFWFGFRWLMKTTRLSVFLLMKTIGWLKWQNWEWKMRRSRRKHRT